jgi:hypothetical protein
MPFARSAFSCSSGSREIAYSRTLVSMNRTAVDLVAVEAISRAEAIDLPLDLMLLGLEPVELGVPIRERAQVLGDESADRAAVLRGADLASR